VKSKSELHEFYVYYTVNPKESRSTEAYYVSRTLLPDEIPLDHTLVQMFV